MNDVQLASGQALFSKNPNLSDQERADASARAEEFLRRSQDAMPLCDGVPNDILLENIYPALLQAAQLGDEDAAVCYVEASFPVRKEVLRSKAHAQSFRDDAWFLIERGLEQGDWRMVDLLADLYSDSNVGKFLFYSLANRDPVRYYQYVKLQSLGASGAYRSVLNEIVSGQAGLISPEDVANGDKFADETYRKYFANSPVLTHKLDGTCPIDD